MVIWINGSFGSGKTQTAYELSKRIPGSYVFDPEETGFYIRGNIPKSMGAQDFQDFDLWRQFNSRMLEFIASQYDGVIIVPMTVTDKNYMKELLNDITANNYELHYFTLTARKETLLKRLKMRGDGHNSWPAKQIDRCVRLLSDESFSKHIHNDEMTIDEVVEDIATSCNIKLECDKRGKLKKTIDRLIVWKKHIRIFNFG